jgi:hypothetical protein
MGWRRRTIVVSLAREPLVILDDIEPRGHEQAVE